MVDPLWQPRPRGPLPLVLRERDVLALAAEVAPRNGDPRPELIQIGSREPATTTTGWIASVADVLGAKYAAIETDELRASTKHA
jgi:hypothetical protein